VVEIVNKIRSEQSLRRLDINFSRQYFERKSSRETEVSFPPKRLFLIILLLLCYQLCSGAEQSGPAKAYDTPNDAGGSISIFWGEFEPLELALPEECKIFRSPEREAAYKLVATVPFDQLLYLDDEVVDDSSYYYNLVLVKGESTVGSFTLGPVKSSPQLFNTARFNVLVGVLICGILVAFFIVQGKTGRELYVRPIAGLSAIDEAIGRATEMGKPILYSSGVGEMSRVATIASMNILGSIAPKIAEYNTKFIFPNWDPVVTAVAQEVVKEGYYKAGHPEAFNPDNIFFVTQSQFGYVAAVDGIMVREKPATNLLLGTFEAESLILAETGNSINAIQIAGTDSSIQLAFFIVACDYVLIGEELFAASGYITKDPMVLGSLKGTDYSKLIIILFVVLGSILGTFGIETVVNWFTVG